MQMLTLATNVAATGVAAQTAVNSNVTPFGNGRDVVVAIDPTVTLTGTPTILIEGSPDGVTYTTLVTHTALYGKWYQVKAQRYMRANVTVAGSAGSFNAYVINGA
jgi:hypothetical protein